MIIGIGHDVTDINRISRMIEGRVGERFLRRVLTVEELRVANNYSGARLHQFIAGRFAAKEAIVKAFGCGIGRTIGFADIEIRRDNLGKPECFLSSKSWQKLGFIPEETRIHVTITHERMLASAFSVVERIS